MSISFNACKELNDQFNSKYKSEEFYFPRAKGSFITPSNIRHILDSSNKTRVGQIQYLLLGNSIVKVYNFYQIALSQRFQAIHTIASAILTVKELKHGKCEMLSFTLMADLFEKGVKTVHKYQVVDERGQASADHAFLVVHIQKKGNYVLDPFFNLFIPYSEYLTHPTFTSYFEARSGIKGWKASDAQILPREYRLTDYQQNLGEIQKQIDAGTKGLSEVELNNLQILKDEFAFVASLNDSNFDQNIERISELLRKMMEQKLNIPIPALLTQPVTIKIKSTDTSSEKKKLLADAWTIFAEKKDLTSLNLSWKVTVPEKGPLRGHEIHFLNFPKDKKELAEQYNILLGELGFSTRLLETVKTSLPSVTVDITNS